MTLFFTFNVCLKTTRVFLNDMIKKKRGHIVGIASMGGKVSTFKENIAKIFIFIVIIKYLGHISTCHLILRIKVWCRWILSVRK